MELNEKNLKTLIDILSDPNILNILQSSKKEEPKNEEYRYAARESVFDTLIDITHLMDGWSERFNSLFNIYLDRSETYILIKRAECDE